MNLPVEGFPGRIEPGLGSRMLPQERIEELRYREQPTEDREPERKPANDPTRYDHPDHALMQQIRKKIEGLNGSGHLHAADNDRISASVYALAKQNNFSSVDEIALSQQTSAAAAGEKIFILQGASDNPAALRAYMPTKEAIQTPVEQSFAKVQTLQSSGSAQERAQQQPSHQIPEQEARQRTTVPSL
ncbi:XVIPCD domain-containing protein [Xanthomonas euvesicatoria]|nr:XVIPCD domain-containing protein [Xanthomonas euvesicatoria]